ncbi:uncharacterized protein K444DRAFT_668608, partial [Hyaloscypha bicolor E]
MGGARRGLTSSIQRWTPFLHLQRRRIFPYPLHFTSLHFALLYFTPVHSTPLTPPLHSLHSIHSTPSTPPLHSIHSIPLPPSHSLHPTPLTSPHSLHHTHFPQSHHRAALTTTRSKASPARPASLACPPGSTPTPPSSTRALSSSKLAPVVPVPDPVPDPDPVPVRPPHPPHVNIWWRVRLKRFSCTLHSIRASNPEDPESPCASQAGEFLILVALLYPVRVGTPRYFPGCEGE